MNSWLKSYGTLQIGNDVVRLSVSEDFAKYYRTFVDKEVRLFTQLPAHGTHITIYRKKIHGDIDPKLIQKLKKIYSNKKIEFYYDINIIEGGKNKNFRNWFFKVRGEELSKISTLLNINQDYHLTVCNTKNGVRPYIWFK